MAKTERTPDAAYAEAMRRIEACWLRGLRVLKLADLALTMLPPEIGSLSTLTELNISNNQLTKLPPEIGKLTDLTRLNITNNQLSKLPPEIGRLTKLNALNMPNNKLTKLPSEISKLTALTEFNISNNQLTKLPPEIGKLTTLTELNISNNQLTALPLEIGKLAKLTWLNISYNQLTILPPEIGKLTALTWLNISNNQLTTVPPEIGELSALTRLNLSDNQLTTLPPEIGKLTALTELGITSNQLTALPSVIGNLTALRQLYLHDNPKIGLTLEVLGPLRHEVRDNNPSASPKAILDTYFALQRGQQPLHEVKLILIGRGEVGKSSLARALMGETFVENYQETPGIGIGTWTLDCHGTSIKVHVWDFAGQEITHEAHRFFLTERCIYLVVTEGRQNLQDMDADHWLAHVQQYGTYQSESQTPQTSPAVVIANKIDSSKAPFEKRRLQREHPCIRGFVETDCKTGTGIPELRAKICDLIASKEMDSVRQPFPTEWREMLKRLENWKGLNRHFFTFAEFEAECRKQGVTDGDQLALTHVLNQLGIALYYGQNPKLRDTRVLDPQWLANGMYALIRGVERFGDKKHPGELREDEIELRLIQGLQLMNPENERGKLSIEDYPTETRKFLLELMEDRELCYVTRETQDGNPIYLLPGLLPTDEPENVDIDALLKPGFEVTRVRFTYKLLPEGLIPRFIVRTHSLNQDLPRWRRGVILQWSGSEKADPTVAVILADAKAKQVEVAVRDGSVQLRQELVGIIRTHLKNIHAEFPKALDPQEELQLSSDGEHWENVIKMELAAQQSIPLQVQVQQKFVDLKADAELKKVEPESAWEEGAGERALRAFVSYSHKDHKYLNRLSTTYLAVLENEKLIRKWTDGEIQAGEDWDKLIRDEIRDADIVILLLSEDFFASKYITGVELQITKDRLQKLEVEIIPVLLSGTSWKQHDWIKALQMAPKADNQQLISLKDFKPRQDKGWEAVQTQLRKVIAELRAKKVHRNS